MVRALTDLLAKRRAYAEHDGERFLDAEQNARLVANAERYYRIMYYGSRASWNLRDSHMFETLKNLLAFYGPDSKAVVWAHNSHVGDAASDRDGRARRAQYRPTLPQGVRRAGLSGRIRYPQRNGCRGIRLGWPDGDQERSAGAARQLRAVVPRDRAGALHAGLCASRAELCGPHGLGKQRLERAIGVIYRPETELASHYFQASLPRQFDEYIWFDDTRAVTPLETAEIKGLPDTYPFGV